MKLRTILKILLLSISVLLVAVTVYDTIAPAHLYHKSIKAEVSPTRGIKVELDDETSWTAVMEVLTIVIGTYAGIKLINKYTK